jgi:hypothetical protein
MDMIKARNLTSHSYNTSIAEEIAADILKRFYPAFVALAETFAARSADADADADADTDAEGDA